MASFRCPTCGATSHHPEDLRHGYCGKCHAFTAEPARASTDPRRLGGAMTGPGGPHDRGQTLLNTDHAVLLDEVHVSTVDDAPGQGVIAMLLSGRINRSPDHAEVLILMDGDGVAALFTELLALASRAGDPRAAVARRKVAARFAALDRADNWGPR